MTELLEIANMGYGLDEPIIASRIANKYNCDVDAKKSESLMLYDKAKGTRFRYTVPKTTFDPKLFKEEL